MGAPVRWGLLSTAKINTPTIAAARGLDNAEITAVASRDASKARAYADEHGIATAHGSYEALLADADVEAVYISLPNGQHHAWTLRALEAGKHVLCEKPYSRHAAEAEEAFARAASAGLVLVEAFMWRHNPQTRLLQQALGEIGAVESIHARFGFRLEDQTNHRLDGADGGSLMDVGCYCVSGVRLVAGAEPELVFAWAVPGPNGSDLRLAGLLEFPGGLTASFASSFSAHEEGLEVVGSDGIVRVPDPWHCKAGIVVVNGEERRVDVVSSYGLQLANVSAAIRGEGVPLLGRADAVGQARTIEALYRSVETGRPEPLGA
jgi:predicted dehydrogenase